MPLGMEVGLCPRDIVLDGDEAPLPKSGTAAPTLSGPCLLWPHGWMNQDTTWYGGRPRPRSYCVRWRPSSPPQKGAQEPPTFRPMSIVTKWLDAMDGSR